MSLARRSLALAFLAFLVAVPARAELRYTMKIESQKNTQPTTTPPNPLMAMIGGIVATTLAPAGGLEITVTMGDRGSRVEYNQAYTVVPAGGITLVRPDGAIVVIDPATKTYWRMAKPDLSMVKADVTIARTGERSTVLGVAAERATFDVKVPLPVPAGTQLPPGIPSSLLVNGEVWVADQYKEYAKMTAGLAGIMSLGLERLSSEGLPMKSVLRGEMFGDQQIASTITSIGEVSVPATAYEVPAGFMEVQPPTSLPGLSRP
jgi:hypothetical protein